VKSVAKAARVSVQILTGTFKIPAKQQPKPSGKIKNSRPNQVEKRKIPGRTRCDCAEHAADAGLLAPDKCIGLDLPAAARVDAPVELRPYPRLQSLREMNVRCAIHNRAGKSWGADRQQRLVRQRFAVRESKKRSHKNFDAE
jgi:hypothetical protein